MTLKGRRRHRSPSLVRASVGRALGRRLRETGWHITSVVTRSESTARRAARYIGAGRPFGELSRLILETALCSSPRRDDAFAPLAEQLAQIGGEEWRGKIILHTSGALDSRALAPLERFGAIVGSIHPLQSFSSRVAPPLDGLWMVIEGMPRDSRWRGTLRTISAACRCVCACRRSRLCIPQECSPAHVLALVETGTRFLTSVGFSRRQASRAVLHLSRASAFQL